MVDQAAKPLARPVRVSVLSSFKHALDFELARMSFFFKFFLLRLHHSLILAVNCPLFNRFGSWTLLLEKFVLVGIEMIILLN